MHQAAGIFFYSINTNRYLYLLRSDTKSWSIPGGSVEKNETLFDGLKRECLEELEIDITDYKLVPIQKFVNNNFVYHTFYCAVDQEFIPQLNHEHMGFAWVNDEYYPKPLHPGLFSTVNLELVQEKLFKLKKKAA
jgi:8-oxo-dGTP pyrophosphatase MutT (NUDIX family)